MDIFEADYSGHNRKPVTDTERAAQLEGICDPEVPLCLAALEAESGAAEIRRQAAARGISRHELARRTLAAGAPSYVRRRMAELREATR